MDRLDVKVSSDSRTIYSLISGADHVLLHEKKKDQLNTISRHQQATVELTDSVICPDFQDRNGAVFMWVLFSSQCAMVRLLAVLFLGVRA